jgi:ParB family chromosome partitioning protein
MEFDDKIIPLSKIDIQDRTYCLSLDPDPTSLLSPIETLGLINPPLVRERKDSRYCIVCGFRRVRACKSLGGKEVPARVLKGDLSEHHLLKVAILDNRSHRTLNVVEQARGIRKLSPHLPAKNRLEVLASLLGFPPNKKVLERIAALDGLPEAIQKGVLDESISFEGAVHLSGMSHEAALSFFDLLKSLKLSQSKEMEIITLIQEIAAREDLTIMEILVSGEIKSILEQPDLNRNEKGTLLRRYLKGRRLPTLVKAEKDFNKVRKELKLNKHLSLLPPPYFEGGPYTIRMSFKDLDDFERCRRHLDHMAKNPALKQLLDR